MVGAGMVANEWWRIALRTEEAVFGLVVNAVDGVDYDNLFCHSLVLVILIPTQQSTQQHTVSCRGVCVTGACVNAIHAPRTGILLYNSVYCCVKSLPICIAVACRCSRGHGLNKSSEMVGCCVSM